MRPPIAITVAALAAAGCAQTSVKGAEPLATEENLAPYFDGFEGTFVLLDVGRNEDVRFNAQRAQARLSPCSTFKIPNALIGLETGVLSGPEHAMTWDGTHYDIEAWNQDQTLRTAVTNSVLWYFQRVAAGIGEARMREFVHAVGYGNEDLSGGLTRFWLDSTLKISADEQVELMRRLARGDLPFSEKTLATVRDLLRLEETDRGTLRGKTGSARASDSHRPLGWFVGYVDHAGATFAFAANIEGEGASGRVARRIAERILRENGML